MLALLTFLIIIFVSLIIVKIGAIALESTGLSTDIAQFQSQSAFTGVGFTTKESESIMVNPIRRRILRFLMLLGSAGLTSAMATLVVTFLRVEEYVWFGFYRIDAAVFSITMIFISIIIIFMISKTKSFDKFIRWTLVKPLHLIKKKAMLYDYENVLGLSHGFSVSAFEVPKRHWMVNKKISDINIEKEGILILGVYRRIDDHEDYIGIPSKDFVIHNKDKIIAYGKEEIISNFAKREKGRAGNKERRQAEKLHKEYELLKKIAEEKLSSVVKKSQKKQIK